MKESFGMAIAVLISYSRFSRDVTVAMLVYRAIAKKVFWEFDSIIMQNLSESLPLFCTPRWPSHHVSENQELARYFAPRGMVDLSLLLNVCISSGIN